MIKKRGNRAKQKNADSKKPSQTVEVVIRKKILGEAPEEHRFVVADGRKLKNIMELADALETMSEEVFRHHANDIRNDFSSWVKDIFYDHSMAEDIARAKNKLEAQVVVLRRMVKELL